MMDAYPDDALLRTAEVARALRLNPQTVRGWCRDGRLSAIAVGGSAGYLMRASDVRAFLCTRTRSRVRDALSSPHDE